MKSGSWFISARSRGRGRSTLNSGPSVAFGPGFSGMMRSASRIASSTSLVIRMMVRFSASRDLRDFVLQLGARQRVERRQRLVEQQHFGLHGERPGDGDALAHAAGELGRPAVGGMARAPPSRHSASTMPGALGACDLPCADAVDGKAHIAANGQPRHQRIGLEDDAALGPGPADRLAAEDGPRRCRGGSARRSARSASSCPSRRSRRWRRTRLPRPRG